MAKPQISNLKFQKKSPACWSGAFWFLKNLFIHYMRELKLHSFLVFLVTLLYQKNLFFPYSVFTSASTALLSVMLSAFAVIER